MTIPSLNDFKQLARQGNLIPVSEEVHFDWETPLSAYCKIASGNFSFLLESVQGGEKWGRPAKGKRSRSPPGLAVFSRPFSAGHV